MEIHCTTASKIKGAGGEHPWDNIFKDLGGQFCTSCAEAASIASTIEINESGTSSLFPCDGDA